MSACGYALHSVCPHFSFFSFSVGQREMFLTTTRSRTVLHPSHSSGTGEQVRLGFGKQFHTSELVGLVGRLTEIIYGTFLLFKI